MNDAKIKVTINKRTLASIWNNEKIIIIIILLIIEQFVQKNTTSVALGVVLYAFDSFQKSMRTGENQLSGTEWNINTELRRIFILAHEIELISFKEKKNPKTIAFALTEKGNELLQKLRNDELINTLPDYVEITAMDIKKNQLKKQRITW